MSIPLKREYNDYIQKLFTSTLSTRTPQGSQAPLNTCRTVLAISSLKCAESDRPCRLQTCRLQTYRLQTYRLQTSQHLAESREESVYVPRMEPRVEDARF